MRPLLDLAHPLPGDPEAAAERFAGDPEGWLPPPGRWRGDRAWTVTLGAGPVGRTVVCRVGPTWSIGGDRWRSVTWEPVPERDDALPVDRGLPRLTGELGVVTSGTSAKLVLRARYQPPGGPMGRLMDAAALYVVARHTAARFLEQVATAVAPAEAAPAER